MTSEFVRTAAEALSGGSSDGDTVLIGGFGPVGQAKALIEGPVERGHP